MSLCSLLHLLFPPLPPPSVRPGATADPAQKNSRTSPAQDAVLLLTQFPAGEVGRGNLCDPPGSEAVGLQDSGVDGTGLSGRDEKFERTGTSFGFISRLRAHGSGERNVHAEVGSGAGEVSRVSGVHA